MGKFSWFTIMCKFDLFTALFRTCADFWQMVWEKQATLIVMMDPHTGDITVPSGEERSPEHMGDSHLGKYCSKYKPSKAGEAVEFGYISIVAQSVQITNYCIATTLKVSFREFFTSRRDKAMKCFGFS